MKNIDISALVTVTGGANTPFQYCMDAVSTKARKFSGADGTMQLGEARDLISSVQGNGFHQCERAGLKRVAHTQTMTGPAQTKIDSFLDAVAR